jgi:hypothetical protein
MSNFRFDLYGRALPLSLCHVLYLCATWIQLAHARPQTSMQMTTVFQFSSEPYTDTGPDADGYAPELLGGLGLIPSAPSKWNQAPSQSGLMASCYI